MIKSLSMPATAGINPIIFPMPRPGGEGTVSLLCGPNGGGKSYILRTLVNLLNGQDAARFPLSQGWSVERSGKKANSYRPRHHVAEMRSAGILGRGRAGRSVGADQTERYAQMLTFGALLAALPQLKGFDPEQWKSSPKYRQSQIDAVGAVNEEQPFWFGAKSPSFVDTFNDCVQGRLGLRRTKEGLELLLAQGGGSTAPYPNWSDGQKSIFIILAVTELLKPDVYIFDEVENFLHPALISRLVVHLRKNCRQTILSSHHPHLIFGSAIDAVYFVERTAPNGDLPSKTLKYQKQPAVARRIILLDDARSKLASTYRLFDVRDSALLATGSLVRDEADLEILFAVNGHFECEAAPPGKGTYMDRQSLSLKQHIAGFAPSPNVVLDWGAGAGRSFVELSKSVAASPSSCFSWILYDLDPRAAQQLSKLEPPANASLTIVQTRTALATVEAGVVLLTNVLHALDPDGWCDAIEDAWRAIRHDGNGIILVTEIYPLLAAERDAVPLPEAWVTALFRSLGFRVSAKTFSIQGAQSYCLAISAPPPSIPEREQLRQIIVERWRELGDIFLDDYEGIARKIGIDENQRLLNAAFGMARIASCLKRNAAG